MNKISSFILIVTILFSVSAQGQIARGNGKIKSETRTYSDFTEVVAIGNFDLYLTRGEKVGVRIDTDENLVNFFQTRTEGNILFIEMLAEVRKFKDLSVYLSVDELTKISALGSVRLLSDEALQFENLDITCGDGSLVELNLSANNLSINFTDFANAVLKGSTKNLIMKCSDESIINAFGLTTHNCHLTTSGYSEVRINVSDEIQIKATGQSNVYYTGNARITERIFSSAGFVVKRMSVSADDMESDKDNEAAEERKEKREK